jgi:hypothetical protein
MPITAHCAVIRSAIHRRGQTTGQPLGFPGFSHVDEEAARAHGSTLVQPKARHYADNTAPAVLSSSSASKPASNITGLQFETLTQG